MNSLQTRWVAAGGLLKEHLSPSMRHRAGLSDVKWCVPAAGHVLAAAGMPHFA